MSVDFPEPPEEFLKYPAGNMIALMTDGDAVAAALDNTPVPDFEETRCIAGWSGRC
jgi:hypothetical protein